MRYLTPPPALVPLCTVLLTVLVGLLGPFGLIPTQAAPAAQSLPTDGCIHLYNNANFDRSVGVMRRCETSINFQSLSAEWNDRFSSIFVPSGKRLIVFEHANYGGKCWRIRGGEQVGNLGALSGNANDKISSFMVNPSEWRWLRCV